MTVLVLPLVLGCKRPPEAPAELSELAGFLFERFLDEDTRDLALGVENLEGWLQKNIEETAEGYTVDNLEQSVIDSVDPDREHDLSKLGGASVASESDFNMRPIASALVLDEQEEVFPDAYDSHDRTFDTDPDCFMSHECDFVDTDNRVEASYAGLLKVSTHSRAQYRWVQWGEDEQWAFLHRIWLLDKAEVSPNLANVHEQLYVGVTLPWKGGSVRLGTTWIAAEVLDGLISEGAALNMMVDAMKKEGENLDEYLGGDE